MPRRTLQLALRILSPFVLSVVLAACGSGNSTPAPAEVAEAVGDAISAAKLVGTNWRPIAIGEPGNSMPIDEATSLTLSFGVERYAGSGGCNWFLGVYVVEGDQIAFRAPAETALICPEPANVMEQEATYLSALQNVIEYRMLEDKLLGFTSEDQLLLTFEPAEPVAFEGTEWALKFQDQNEQAAAVIIGTTITATFDGGRVSGSSGCNTYQGAYTLDGETLSITDLAVTEMACDTPEGVMDQEQLYLANLASATRLLQTGGVLQLLNAGDVTVLAFGAP
jgi:heat shock protein HslJ